MSMERYACGAYACGEVRPLAYEFFANFSKLAGIYGLKHAYSSMK